MNLLCLSSFLETGSPNDDRLSCWRSFVQGTNHSVRCFSGEGLTSLLPWSLLTLKQRRADGLTFSTSHYDYF